MSTPKAKRSEVERLVDGEEYEALREMGEAILPHLRAIAANEVNWQRGAKAIYAAALVGGPAAAEIVDRGARSRKPNLRISAANASVHLPQSDAEPIVVRLLRSKDAGIRKTAIQAALGVSTPTVVGILDRIAKNEKEHPKLTDLSAKVLRAVKK